MNSDHTAMKMKKPPRYWPVFHAVDSVLCLFPAGSSVNGHWLSAAHQLAVLLSHALWLSEEKGSEAGGISPHMFALLIQTIATVIACSLWPGEKKPARV